MRVDHVGPIGVWQEPICRRGCGGDGGRRGDGRGGALLLLVVEVGAELVFIGFHFEEEG